VRLEKGPKPATLLSLAVAFLLGALTPITAAIAFTGPVRSSLMASGAVLGLVSCALFLWTAAAQVRRRRSRSNIDTGHDLTGIWLSQYAYRTSRAQGQQQSKHYVTIRHREGEITARSLPNREESYLEIDLILTGSVLTGSWRERTSPKGIFKGAVYHGAIHLVLEPTGIKMNGRWVGFTRRSETRSGTWSLERVVTSINRATRKSYTNRL
jgi:hypothetical protein